LKGTEGSLKPPAAALQVAFQRRRRTAALLLLINHVGTIARSRCQVVDASVVRLLG